MLRFSSWNPFPVSSSAVTWSRSTRCGRVLCLKQKTHKNTACKFVKMPRKRASWGKNRKSEKTTKSQSKNIHLTKDFPDFCASKQPYHTVESLQHLSQAKLSWWHLQKPFQGRLLGRLYWETFFESKFSLCNQNFAKLLDGLDNSVAANTDQNQGCGVGSPVIRLRLRAIAIIWLRLRTDSDLQLY